MSESLSLPKIKLISPEKRKEYYEKILSDIPTNNNNNSNNKLKNIQIKKINTKTKDENNNTDNIQTTRAICNIIDLINDNNLNIFYKEDNSNFKRNIDQLNLKFYLETEKIISSNQNKTKDENNSFNSNKLFLILFKQINLYIKEIERLNTLMLNSVKDKDNIKKKMEIFIRKQNDFETKEQIIQALKYSVTSLEKKLSNVLISENNLRQDIQKLKKEKDFYYEYYKLNISSSNKKNNKNKKNINKFQTINDLKKSTMNNNQHLKHNTKDNFFPDSKDIIILGDIKNNNILINDHKRNNSENDFPSKNKNSKNMPISLQNYYNGSPKRNKKNAINIKNKGNNNNSNTRSIIRLCNYYSHNIEIDIPLGLKSKSPEKSIRAKGIEDFGFTRGRKNSEKESFHKSTINNENRLGLNIVNNNNNTFIFENSYINRNKTIYNTISQNKDLSINHLFKNRKNSDNQYIEEGKSKNIKLNLSLIKKDSVNEYLDNDFIDLNTLESLLIEIKDYIINNEKNNNKFINKNRNIPKNKNNSIQNNYIHNGKKINNNLK